MNSKPHATMFPPNEMLKAFEPLIGNWKTVGTHGMIPDTTLHGSTAFSWHESGAFIIMNTYIDEDVGIPIGLAVIGSDNGLDVYEMLYYDERGVSRNYHLKVDGKTITWWRDGPEFSQRTTLTISDDEQTMIGKGEICKEGVSWEQDLDLTYSKI